MTTNQSSKRLYSRAALLLLTMMLTTATAGAGITPTTPSQDGDGYYSIGTAAELYGFAEIVNGGNATANAKLTADIVVNENVLAANGDANTGDFVQWTPLGNDRYNDKVYSGTFDGQGHTISGLYVSGSDADQFFGLIGTAGASVVVKNLGVVDSYFGNSNNQVGSIVGNVYVGSNVTLANVYSTSTVSGDNWIGGLVGGDGSGSVTIINSYFAGKTSSTFLSGQYGTHHDDLVSGEFGMPISGTLNVVNSFVLGTSLYGTSATASQLTDGTVAAALHYYQDAIANGSIWGISGGKTDFSGTLDGVSVTTADITLHTFDGNTTAYSSKYVVGNTTPLPVNVEREGYTFLGWYDNANFEGDAVTQISSSETGDKEYWAKFVLNGGTIQSGEIDHYIEGETTVLPTVVTKNGASFEGWYTTENFTGDRYYSIPATATEDMTFYAKWGEEKTMFYLVQGGSPEPVNILYEGENIVWLDETTMDGYYIMDNQGNGWGDDYSSINVPYSGGEYTFGNGGRMFNVAQSGFYVFTLTDKGNGSWFISVLYSLADHCTVADIPDQIYTGSAIEPEIEIETTLTFGTDYTIEYSDNTNAGTATVTITGIGNYGGTITKTFNIVIINYTVSFDANGGEGTMEPMQLTYNGDWTTLTANTFTRTGYGFSGWNTEADGGGTPYSDEEWVRNLTDEADGNVVLYAQWGKDIATCTATMPDQTMGTYSYIVYKFEAANSDATLAAEMGVVVKDGDNILTLGTDYEFGNVTFADHSEGMPENQGDECLLEIKGKGNYAGSLWAPFTITVPDDGGTWGDLAWSFHAGTLTITGTGAMDAASDYSSYPWFAVRGYVKAISIGEGITTIAAAAFASPSDIHYYTNVATLSLPTTLESIGEDAFAYCTSLTAAIPTGVTIGTDAFYRVGCLVGSLSDTADNSDVIALMKNALSANVTLADRTLYKDGKWNTLCLPFALSAEQIAAHADFNGATLMELDTDGKNGFDTEDGTLWLTFKKATAITAGTPYLVKWSEDGDDFTSPTFSGVTISALASTTVTGTSAGLEEVQMVGSFSPVAVTADDKSILFLGEANTLYYSTIDRDIRSCRAYFSVPYIRQHAQAHARAFRLDFGEGDASGIVTVSKEAGSQGVADAWYTLDGRRLQGKPTAKGLYIYGSKKVMIK